MYEEYEPDFPEHDDVAEIDAIIAEVWGQG